MPTTHPRIRRAVTLPILMAVAGFPTVHAQAGATRPSGTTADTMQMTDMADHAMDGAMTENMLRHMELTPLRAATHADSARAMDVAAQLKRAIAKYQDTAVAVRDGYKMFLPGVKNQQVYHFTNYGNGFKEAFRFNPAEPTSLLYKRGADGKLYLVGAMYTMPENASLDRLDARIPLSIARWHKHVDWCLPSLWQSSRWTETKNGVPVFGADSPIATKAECDAVHGVFHPTLLGWMIHANVYEGSDLAVIWGDNHHGGRAPR